jgi:hypothetical protein
MPGTKRKEADAAGAQPTLRRSVRARIVQSPQSNVPGGGGLDYGATAQREATQLVLQNCGGARSGARGAVQEQAEEQFNNMSSEESGDGEILPATDPRGDAEIVFGHTAEAIAAAGCRAEDNRAAQQFIKQYNRHVTGDHMRFQNTLTKSVVGMARVYARALRSEEWSAARIAYSQFIKAFAHSSMIQEAACIDQEALAVACSQEAVIVHLPREEIIHNRAPTWSTPAPPPADITP